MIKTLRTELCHLVTIALRMGSFQIVCPRNMECQPPFLLHSIWLPFFPPQLVYPLLFSCSLPACLIVDPRRSVVLTKT